MNYQMSDLERLEECLMCAAFDQCINEDWKPDDDETGSCTRFVSPLNH